MPFRKLFLFYWFVFRQAVRLVGSQFPDEGLNRGHGSESLES